jgi:DNA-directed RNA polymerase subunit omega
MNSELIEQAREVIPDVPILVNIISKRVRQLNAGHPPLIQVREARINWADVALREVIEGKLEWSVDREGVASISGH